MNFNSPENKPLDIHVCYSTIPLKELIVRHTGKIQMPTHSNSIICCFCFLTIGVKGWYPLVGTNNVGTSALSSNPIENCVGGIELFIRFGQQNDRYQVIESAKRLGWFDDNYVDEENFIDSNFDYSMKE